MEPFLGNHRDQHTNCRLISTNHLSSLPPTCQQRKNMPKILLSSARLSLVNLQVNIVPLLFLRPISCCRFLLSHFTLFFGFLEGTSDLAFTCTSLHWRNSCVWCVYFIPLLKKLIYLQKKQSARPQNIISDYVKLSFNIRIGPWA